MNFEEYIKNIEAVEFQPTGLTKEIYLDLMELALGAYSKEQLEARLPKGENDLVEDIQAYSRITGIIGVLLANGRCKGYRELWDKMMDACCRSLYRYEGDARVDFSVKEIMLSFKAMKSIVSEEKKAQWLKSLKIIDPYKNYIHRIKDGEERHLHNINIYNMVGEYLRETEGLTKTEEYFRKHWPLQLQLFDENGMYMDPGCPMLYDVTTRCQIQIMLEYGYRGEFYQALDEQMKKAGLWTLFMQSAAFELPYGGRSNQYQFNEALVAANCEYEAARYKKLGDLKTAGMFKRCAHLAVQAVLRWVRDVYPPRHIKNFYPIETKHGTETYGYYDKYMATMGSFIYLAFLSADDGIEEVPSPAELGGYVLETSEAFHKVFANCSGHSIEIDTKADKHYDSTGLGRYHRAGAPSELALSTPLTETPSYCLLEGLLKKDISLCPGWKDPNGTIRYLSEFSEDLECNVKIIETGAKRVVFSVEYKSRSFDGCEGVLETYRMDEDGVSIRSELIHAAGNSIFYMVPLFRFNGRDRSLVQGGEGKLEVAVDGFTYTVSTDGSVNIVREGYGNRNGEYYLGILEGLNGRLEVKLHLSYLRTK